MEFIKEQKNKSIFKTYFIYFICIVCFVLLRIIGSLGLFKELSDNMYEIVYTVLVEIITLFLIPLILYCLFIKVKPKQVFATCNFNKCNLKTILISIILGFIIYFLTVILSTFFNGIIILFGYTSSSSGSGDITTTSYIIQIFTVAILPAFCEEFLHRGILLQGTKHMGFTKAIITSGILFGLIHLNITQVFYAMILGIVIGYISVISKNIWPAIIVHFMNNFMSITSSYLQTTNEGFAKLVNQFYISLNNMNFILLIISITIILAIIVFAIYFLVSKLYQYSIISKVTKAINQVYNKNGQAISNTPIQIYDSEVRSLIENTTTLNLDFSSAKSPIDIIMPKQTKIYKTNYKDKIFLKASYILTIIITVFTFIWGVL